MKIVDFEERPWGRYDVVSRLTASDPIKGSMDLVIKKITVMPGTRLSYQSHRGRDEHWYIVSGMGVAVINDQDRRMVPGDSADVKIGDKHRIGNTGNTPLVFIEIATGVVDEDDVVRYEDDFGRVKPS